MTRLKHGPGVTAERVEEQFKTTISSDFFHLFAGDFLGGGVGRGVFACSLAPTLVIKVEVPVRSFQNVVEWEAWQEIKSLRHSIRKWFAPCLAISPCGIIMTQRRTTPLREEELPKKVPAFFTDTKLSNFGHYQDRIVAHDYGFTDLISSGLSSKMKNADWEIS